MHPYDAFGVDVDGLDDVVHDLATTVASLERTTDDLDRRLRVLHDTWDGLAAQAHTEAHRQWSEGMQAIHQAMSDLRAAASSAHANYTGAAQANLQMWQALT